MEALECIKTRRSVRKYSDQPVTRETLDKIFEAVTYAPSWKNTQSVRYTVVDDPRAEGGDRREGGAGLCPEPEDHQPLPGAADPGAP